MPNASHFANHDQRSQVGSCRQIKPAPYRRTAKIMHDACARFPNADADKRRHRADALIQAQIAKRILSVWHPRGLFCLLCQVIEVAKFSKRRICRLPRFHVLQIAVFRRLIDVRHDALIA